APVERTRTAHPAGAQIAPRLDDRAAGEPLDRGRQVLRLPGVYRALRACRRADRRLQGAVLFKAVGGYLAAEVAASARLTRDLVDLGAVLVGNLPPYGSREVADERLDDFAARALAK